MGILNQQYREYTLFLSTQYVKMVKDAHHRRTI